MTRRFYCINLGFNMFSSFRCCFSSKPDFLYIITSARAFISPWMSDFSNAFPQYGRQRLFRFQFSALCDELWHFRLSSHMLTTRPAICAAKQQLLCDYMSVALYITTSLMHQWIQIYKRIVFSWLVLIWFIAGWVRVLSSFFVRAFAFRFFRL